jgi:nucleotide-binding universal stress UspA family protein
MFEKILVPLDGSQYSGRAIPYAIEIAKRFGGKVIFMQVVRPTPVLLPTTEISTTSDPVTTQMVIESARVQDKTNVDHTKRYLKRKLRQAVIHGINGSYVVVLGEPAKAIIEFCKEESVDLVVMTTAGKSGLKRAFLGSVADVIVREPGIPVLAIRPATQVKKK